MPVDKSDRRIREMFGEISRRYDFLNHFLSAGTDFYWRWRCVRAAPLDGDLPILDVCTGTGDLAIAFWRHAGGRLHVIGADFTHEMLQLAGRKDPDLLTSVSEANLLGLTGDLEEDVAPLAVLLATSDARYFTGDLLGGIFP